MQNNSMSSLPRSPSVWQYAITFAGIVAGSLGLVAIGINF